VSSKSQRAPEATDWVRKQKPEPLESSESRDLQPYISNIFDMNNRAIHGVSLDTEVEMEVVFSNSSFSSSAHP